MKYNVLNKNGGGYSTLLNKLYKLGGEVYGFAF